MLCTKLLSSFDILLNEVGIRAVEAKSTEGDDENIEAQAQKDDFPRSEPTSPRSCRLFLHYWLLKPRQEGLHECNGFLLQVLNAVLLHIEPSEGKAEAIEHRAKPANPCKTPQ